MYAAYVPTCQTLKGWAMLLNINVADLEGLGWEQVASTAFPLPTHERVMDIMASKLASIKEGTLTPDHTIKQVIGRMKGTVEEIMKKKEKLAAEVKQGLFTGVSTTPLDGVMDTRRGEGKEGKGGERKCKNAGSRRGTSCCKVLRGRQVQQG
mmetsp:Transcript_27987/g.60241  ORF Transcript_27987/g.60241 Transcript_27987/m.60241 type:complete len:152 (-) Transcript_27987:458-913(-)